MCQPIAICQVKNLHLSDLTLTDSADAKNCLHVDVLIGSDQYWSLINREIWCRDAGLAAVHMDLGWVLSGSLGCLTYNTDQVCLVTHTLCIDGTLTPRSPSTE